MSIGQNHSTARIVGIEIVSQECDREIMYKFIMFNCPPFEAVTFTVLFLITVLLYDKFRRQGQYLG